jgi:uncharacterized protein involved in outer membrane biogenesis
LNRIKRYIIIVGISFLALVFTLVGLGFFFEDEILDKVRVSVNENLDVPIKVSSMDFSLLSHFPQASIRFHDLSIPDKLDSTLFLVQAKELSLHFDIWDIISGTYVIDKASLSQATLRMHSDAKGNENYIFWKESEESQNEVAIDLQEFTLNDVQYSYKDDELTFDLQAHVQDAVLQVHMKDEWIEIQSDLKAEKSSVSYDGTVYVEERSVAYEGKMRITTNGKDTRLAKSVIKVGKMDFELEGRVHDTKEGWMVNLQVASSAVLHELIPELPPSFKDGLAAYETTGDLSFTMNIKGITGNGTYPVVDAEFELKKGKVGLNSSSDRLSQIYAKGRYQRDERGIDVLTLVDSKGEISAGHIAFKGVVKDLKSPMADGRLELDGELKDFLALMEESPFTKASGEFSLNVDLKGKIPKEGFNSSDATALGMRGTLTLEDISFRIGVDGYQISELNGEVLLKGDDLLFDPLNLICNGSKIELSGSMSGLLAHLSDEKKPLGIKSKVISDKVNWEKWAIASSTSEEGGEATIPSNIDLALEIDLASFQYANFTAEGVKGSLALKGNTVRLKPLTFKSCKGDLLASLSFVQKENKSWTMSAEGELRNMDVSEILRQFDHFGQTFITDKQIKGKGNAHVSFKGDFSPSMSLAMNSIVSDIDITLENGELIQHPSMVDIIKAMRDQKMTRSFVRIEDLEKEMRHLKFKQLRNTIHIESGQIQVPEMLIANNAMDVLISGKQTFKNDIDYTVSFNMRDVLINKNNPEFLIQDDGLGHVINMRMYGTVDNPIIEMDKGKAKENRKEAVTQAKDDVKNFFKDPLGRKNNSTEAKHDIVLEVEEGADKSVAKENTNSTVDPKKKKWWNTPTSEEEVKKAPVIVIDDDF